MTITVSDDIDASAYSDTMWSSTSPSSSCCSCTCNSKPRSDVRRKTEEQRRSKCPCDSSNTSTSSSPSSSSSEHSNSQHHRHHSCSDPRHRPTTTTGSFQLLHKLLLLLVTAVLLPQYSHCCSCTYSMPQQSFCDAHFVMKARVRSSQVVLSDDMKPLNRSLELAFRLDERLYWEYVPRLLRRYKLRIIQVFKGQEKLKKVRKSVIYTSVDDSRCGTKLKEYSKYLIMGHVNMEERFLHISSCLYHRPWAEVHQRVRKSVIENLYLNNCNCSIDTCYYPGCMNERQAPNECRWNPREDTRKCYPANAICVQRTKRDGSTKCKWAPNTYLTKCLKKNMSPNTNVKPHSSRRLHPKRRPWIRHRPTSKRGRN